MPCTINASTTSGLIQTADTSGNVTIQTNGTETARFDTSQQLLMNIQYGGYDANATGAITLNANAAVANTGASTLTVQVNSSTILASTSILNEDGSALTGNEILANGIYTVVYNGSSWVLAGGGAGSGASAGGAVYENTQTISANYTMTSGKNGESVGPITIATGITVTIPSGSRWVVL